MPYGISKADKDELGKAVTMYRNIVGVDLSSTIAGIPVVEEGDDAKDRSEAAQKELDARAKVDRELERAHQEQRRLNIENDHLRSGKNADGTDKDSGTKFNQGPGAPATITEEAKRQGLKPASAPNNPKA